MTRYNDADLLRRFEPQIHYNAGERFFPMDVEPYVRECSLWVQRPGEAAERLIPEGELTLEHLTEPRTQGFEAVTFLKFIEPLNVAELAAYNIKQALERDKREIFHAGRGRLARVGYGSRLADVAFSLSLLARGRVPGDTSAAAARTYQRIMDASPHRAYYGRVVRRGGWIALQYWFFYAYNNWRSGFFGVNDHESDWEQICVYIYEDGEGEVLPAWVAYASHDFSGDDLRRRWDDPDIIKVNDEGHFDAAGMHPVIYAGAGSHASYFTPGEYLAEIELPFLRPLVQLVDRFNRARERARENFQGGVQIEGQTADTSFNLFRIPFVDYARGDGYIVGPGGDYPWDDPRVLDDENLPGWALNYRGLWGLYARDPLSGEDAPGGPLYNRDGRVRKAWYDPLGWAGLDKVPPPPLALRRLYDQRAAIISRDELLEDEITALDTEIEGLGIEVEAMRGQPHLAVRFEAHRTRIAALTAQADEKRASLTQDAALLQTLNLHETRLHQGILGPMRAHISKAHHPASQQELRTGLVAEFWSAVSIGLALILFVALLVFNVEFLWVGLLQIAVVFALMEALFRRRLGQLVTILTIVLAVFSSLLLLYEFFWPIMILVVLVIGVYTIVENVRELFA